MVEPVEPLTERVDLADLRHHWGDAYVIVSGGKHAWSARRMDDPEGSAVLKASSPERLLELIRLDYQSSPVPRR
jgi:hypothetical protein